MTHLIVFDLDGTLVDSRLDLTGSANRLLDQLGAGPLPVDQVVGMVGEGARVLVGRVLAAAGVEVDLDVALARFLTIYDEHLVDHTRLYPGVIDALQALESRAALAVLTNKPGHHTTRLLEALGIHGCFFEVIGGDGRWPRKPDPAALQHLMAVSGAEHTSAIMVGDSMVDVETARRAEARVCIARYGFGHIPDDVATGAIVADDARQLQALLLSAIGDKNQ
jgi:phosphoglycolate phosphatase